MQTPSAQPERAPGKRKRNFAILFIVLLLIAAGCCASVFPVCPLL